MGSSILAYIIGILVALPVFAMIAVVAYLFVRLFIQWLLFDGGPAQPSVGKRPVKGQVTVKG